MPSRDGCASLADKSEPGKPGHNEGRRGAHRYIDEQAFRYNHRADMTDSDRFHLAVSHIVGKHLTYAELTGKIGETTLN